MKKNYFCENLKCIRSSLNISQKEIADYLKLNPSSYSNYENGRREPGIDILINISNFLNIEIDKLLTENLFNNEEFLKNIEIKFLNDDLDYNKKIEDINSNLYKNIILELEKQKKKYLSIINNDIPQKIKEIDSLIEYINLYNKKSLETNNEMSLNVTLNNSNKNND
ncbi:helix-turn-helix domain-containing protein [uncultured Clostridium sp.]|uniref:helix-turn-helix domain-containing protein n=1 Tax=uncultured Clostridium sp. TaxID=59620 RepID=UPI00272FBDDF|nr:helix-turn-helix transcriptional regulator [uncultured Clostridium sp.]